MLKKGEKVRFRNKYLILIILLLFLLPQITAQPPFQVGEFTTGYFIESQTLQTYKNGEHILFNSHVFNISSGVRITNTTANCTFHLFNNQGEHILNQIAMNFDTVGMDWELNVTGTNFTTNGDFSTLTVCQGTGLGGFLVIGFEVTPTGTELTPARGIIYLGLLLGVLFVFSLTMWGSIVLPFKNKRGALGEIVDVGFLKYFKIMLIFLTYALLVWVINLLLTLSNSFILLSQYVGFFTMVFVILRSLIWPLFVLMWIAFIVMGWRDLQLVKLLTRGIVPK